MLSTFSASKGVDVDLIIAGVLNRAMVGCSSDLMELRRGLAQGGSQRRQCVVGDDGGVPIGAKGHWGDGYASSLRLSFHLRAQER